jgi:hypothetical protein
MATSTTIKPKAPATSDLQAVNWGKLFKDVVNLGKAVYEWAKQPKNWPSVVGIGQGLKDFISFVISIFQPKTSAEYQSMTNDGKKAVDRFTKDLTQAFIDGDSAGVVSNLKAIANTYETQAKIVGDPIKAKALQNKAQGINAIADGIASGEIPLDRGIADRVKGVEKEGNQDLGVSSGNTTQESLNQNLDKLVEKALTNLGVNQINDTNSRHVAGKLLIMGASPEVAIQSLSHYYETTAGLSKTKSIEKATENVADAGNELNGANPDQNTPPQVPDAGIEPGG